ncbi:ABC transporter transmembrane domain-containing protein [Parvibium lacunae]|uniref:ATP-binding cassette domain-containing protein n=1 Tax=Parvibium lacunae TaxID=1888893 RepID=A0A368L4A5_9BURK|nr:ABC transporter transmembrane domain-containing protein [Parvibium lacunae]RCS58313.1 ATP-binding cassette domain-containing protein [Parvibium lacunae]
MSSFRESKILYRRLLGFVRPYWRIFALSIVCMVASAATEPAFPELLARLLSGFSQPTTTTYFIPLIIIGLFLLRGILSFVQDYAFSWVSNKVVTDVRQRMYDKVLQLPMQYLVNTNTGVVISRVCFEVAGVAAAATSVLTTLVSDSVRVLALTGYLLYLNWQLTVITLITIPLTALIVKQFSKRLRQASRGSQVAAQGLTQVLNETLDNFRIIKVFGGQARESQRFFGFNDKLRRMNMKQAAAAAASGPIVHVIAAFGITLVIYFALFQGKQGGLTAEQFVAFMTAMMALIAPLKRLADINAPLQRGLAAAEAVFAVLDEAEEENRGAYRFANPQQSLLTGPAQATTEQVQLVPALPKVRGEIALSAVSYQYPGANRLALDQVSLTIQPGETVALVGPSGGGKTTLINLIPRFFNVQEGVILIDGIDVREIELNSLRQQIAIVSQDVTLFNDSVAGNIAYTVTADHPDAAAQLRERVIAAAKAANAHAFIMALPDGYETLIGENGVKLSGGQRQRLAIARAVFKQAPILILDEATSALDSESERVVQEALDGLLHQQTTLVIAHRLSTIEQADRIAVLEGGKLVELGNHASLLAQEGVYAHLYHIQYNRSAPSSTTSAASVPVPDDGAIAVAPTTSTREDV